MNMNILQLRGSLVSIIADVDNEQVLRQIFNQSLQILLAHDLGYQFPSELLAELEEAYVESDDESETISNDAAFKLFRQWANQ